MNIATWFFNFYNESCVFVLILFGIVYVINEGSAQKVIYLATQLIFYNWRQKEFNEKIMYLWNGMKMEYDVSIARNLI